MNSVLLDAHKPKMQGVMNELFVKHAELTNRNNHCANCGDYYEEDTYSTYIFWRKYKFCSDWCQYDLESDIRKRYRRCVK